MIPSTSLGAFAATAAPRETGAAARGGAASRAVASQAASSAFAAIGGTPVRADSSGTNGATAPARSGTGRRGSLLDIQV